MFMKIQQVHEHVLTFPTLRQNLAKIWPTIYKHVHKKSNKFMNMFTKNLTSS
nr:protein [Spodoptera litura nucleopolyhedrovirus]